MKIEIKNTFRYNYYNILEQILVILSDHLLSFKVNLTLPNQFIKAYKRRHHDKVQNEMHKNEDRKTVRKLTMLSFLRNENACTENR